MVLLAAIYSLNGIQFHLVGCFKNAPLRIESIEVYLLCQLAVRQIRGRIWFEHLSLVRSSIWN